MAQLDKLGLDDAAVYELLNSSFDEEELRTLCFGLGVDYDSLPGEGKRAKARELVGYLGRRNERNGLDKALVSSRPGVVGRAIGKRFKTGPLPTLPKGLNGDAGWYIYVRDSLAMIQGQMRLFQVFAIVSLIISVIALLD